jgi:hypothetical protein
MEHRMKRLSRPSRDQVHRQISKFEMARDGQADYPWARTAIEDQDAIYRKYTSTRTAIQSQSISDGRCDQDRIWIQAWKKVNNKQNEIIVWFVDNCEIARRFHCLDLKNESKIFLIESSKRSLKGQSNWNGFWAAQWNLRYQKSTVAAFEWDITRRILSWTPLRD